MAGRWDTKLLKQPTNYVISQTLIKFFFFFFLFGHEKLAITFYFFFKEEEKQQAITLAITLLHIKAFRIPFVNNKRLESFSYAHAENQLEQASSSSSLLRRAHVGMLTYFVYPFDPRHPVCVVCAAQQQLLIDVAINECIAAATVL